MVSRLVASGLGVLMFVAATAGDAIAIPFQDCAAAKRDAAGNKATRKLKCFRDAVDDGGPVDTLCLAKADVFFADDFADAEKGLCLTMGDVGDIEDKVDAFVYDVVSELPPGTGGARCAADKIEASRKKAGSKLECQAEAAHDGTSPDPNCLLTAELNFLDAFAVAESRSPCNTTGDAATIESKVDAFVNDVVTELPGGSGKCTAGKRKAAAKKASSKLLCHAKGAGDDVPAAPDCLTAAEDNFDASFVHAEGLGPCPGDQATTEGLVDDCVSQVVAALPGSGTCTAGKRKAAAKKAARKLKCYAKAALQSALKPVCLTDAETKFGKLFAYAESKGPCAGEAGSLESLVDSKCVSDVLGELPLLEP